VTPRAPRLAGTNWTLVSQDGLGTLPGTRVTAAFGADRRLSGSAGCNRYVGAYELSGPGIEVGPLATTRMFCAPAGVMEQEQRYLVALQRVALVAMNGEQLLLVDATGAHELLFARTPESS
jgi:heat shock protein HslJ